jgi:hypothetical protein
MTEVSKTLGWYLIACLYSHSPKMIQNAFPVIMVMHLNSVFPDAQRLFDHDPVEAWFILD